MSVAVHVLVALLLLIPAVAALIVHVSTVSRGGGSVMRGFIHERLHYVASPPASSAPVSAPVQPVPRPAPVVRPPEPKPPPPPTSAVPVHDSSAVAQVPGDGAGHDEGGAGRGAGVGTGTGNGTGPGTGGQPIAKKIHAATDVMTVATIDPPLRPRPFHLHAVFAVDTRGNAKLLTVNKADDGEFNRTMHDRLMETHFKPATLPDGTPVADTVALDIDY
jgi:hypothetical protein